MARYPTPGKVKTRLAAEIGPHRAATLYRRWLRQLAREFSHAPFHVEWRFTPSRAPFRRVTRCPGAAYRPQPPGNLGHRLTTIVADSFAAGYRRVIVIGTDCPLMTRTTIMRAFRLLHRYPVVIQPTDDGGYALIGLTAPFDLFRDIAWSTDRVMEQTRQRLRQLNLSWRELPSTFDIDTRADLDRWRALQRGLNRSTR
ncbi:MAG: TIGR04282 family arsenosugar biosynthesis glycosyltransferase [Verrucomicrobiae bacterium]|nr:TIGR04282 family arsenosugar biosynthesis glycosyltransferase [Verrucomicrobiae bacterium]